MAGFAEGRGGDLLEEAVQFGLQGGLGLVEQEQRQMFEGQRAVAGEILGTLTVLGNKGGIIKQIGYFLYNFQSGPGPWLGMSTVGFFGCFIRRFPRVLLRYNYMIFMEKCY